MRSLFLTLITALFLILPYTPFAHADSYKDMRYIADPYYQFMVKQLNTYVPEDFDYDLFRLRYYQSSYYDPIGDTLIEGLMKLSFEIENAEDEEKKDKKLKEYRRTVNMHLANLGVVTQALAMSRKDSKFGNVEMLQNLRNGLLKSVLYSGNGGQLSSAYDVITFTEETMLLHRLNIDVQETRSEKEDIVYYNMHIGTDKRKKKEKIIFVDISMPMTYLKHKLEEKGETTSTPIIPKQ